jgi:hypothetical protein
MIYLPLIEAMEKADADALRRVQINPRARRETHSERGEKHYED